MYWPTMQDYCIRYWSKSPGHKLKTVPATISGFTRDRTQIVWLTLVAPTPHPATWVSAVLRESEYVIKYDKTVAYCGILNRVHLMIYRISHSCSLPLLPVVTGYRAEEIKKKYSFDTLKWAPPHCLDGHSTTLWSSLTVCNLLRFDPDLFWTC
jgi:hypothetical protein